MPQLGPSETGIEWFPLLAVESLGDEESWVVPSHFEAVLVIASSLGSEEMFLRSVEVGAEAVTGRSELP